MRLVHADEGPVGGEGRLRENGPDGLAGAGVVGEEETQRLHGQEFFVDGDDLVGEGLDEGSVDGEHRVEEVGEPDALGLGGELEEVAVAVAALARRPGATISRRGSSSR